MSNSPAELLANNKNFLIKLVNAAVIAVVILFYNGWAAGAAANDAAVTAQMEADAQAARAASSSHGPYATDGTFSGSAQGYGGTVTTQVVIQNGYITSVEVIDHAGETEAYFAQAQALTEKIVTSQGTAVDAVSGATFSSAGINNGVNEALLASGIAQDGE